MAKWIHKDMGRLDKEVLMLADNIILLIEKRASKLIDQGRYEEAEKLLEQNLVKKIDSFKTYQLMFQLYSLKNDYSNMIKVLNQAIRYSRENKDSFKELKRLVLLDRILKDLGTS